MTTYSTRPLSLGELYARGGLLLVILLFVGTAVVSIAGTAALLWVLL